MKHKIKNINPAEKTLPAYDGTDRFIKFEEIMEVEVTEKVQYMINNGFFEDLGEVKEEKPKDEDVDKALKNIDEEQEDFFPKDEAEKEEQKKAINEDYESKPHKKKGKKQKRYTEDD